MRWSFRIFTVLGIPIYIHLTLLLIIPLFAWIFAFQNVPILGLDTGFGGVDLSFLRPEAVMPVRLFLGSIAAIFFFGSILIHELTHSYVAIRYGAKIRSIVLIIFGGVSQVEEIPKQPAAERNMALAGPASNFVIAGVAFAVLQLPLRGLSTALDIVLVFASITVFYNLLLGLFNLVPAFPMDGGRILRASLARRRSYLAATQAAATVGKLFAVLFGIIGVLFQPFLILIAFLVYIGAGQEERLTRVTVTLEGVSVQEIMTREVDTVSPDTTVTNLLARMTAERHMGYPVVDGGLQGMVTFKDAAAVPGDRRDSLRVRDIASKDVFTVEPGALALDAMKQMSTHNIGRLVVTEEARIVGILTRTDLVKALSIYQVQRGL